MTDVMDDRTGSGTSGDRDGAALLMRFQAGDRAAFTAFVELHTEHCYRLALRLLGQRSDAEDATQSAFLQVFLHADTFRPGASARAWLGGIVANCCHGLRRREQALQRRHSRAFQDVVAITSTESPDGRADDCAERELVDQELARLDPDERLALWLRHGEGLRFREIAERLGVPQKTVESRVQRTLAVVRARLAMRARQDAGALARPRALMAEAFAWILPAGMDPQLPAWIHATVARAAGRRGVPGPLASLSASPVPAAVDAWWSSTRTALAAGIVVAATLALLMARSPASPRTGTVTSARTAATVIDHPAGTDLLRPLPTGPRVVPADHSCRIRFVCTVLSLDTSRLGRALAWSQEKNAVVVPAALVRLLLAAGGGMVSGSEMTCWQGEVGTASFLTEYAYISDYESLQVGPDPSVGVMSYGASCSIGGMLAEGKVLVTTLRHYVAQPLRICVSQFMGHRPGDGAIVGYPVEEPEFTFRQSILAEPLAIAADEGLVVRVGPAEHHRIRALKARSFGQEFTQLSVQEAPPSKPVADEREQMVLVTAEVVPGDPAGDDAVAAPGGIARR